MNRSKGMVIGFWIVTALFCLQIGFTAYAQLACRRWRRRSRTSASPITSGWSSRGPSCSASVLLLAPVPARLKEWAYAGFAINIVSALIAHIAVGDGPEAWGWAAGTGVLWGLSYFFWRRLDAAPAFQAKELQPV